MRLMHLPGLWLLLGLVPIVLLYVLKTRRIRMRVPSTWLWMSAQRDLQARTPFKRLQRELPLFLELLALALLALAISAPACRGRSLVGEHVAIVLDVSASMSARDERTGRRMIDDARIAARRIVDSLAFGSDAMLVTSGRDARVLFALGRDRGALRRGIDRANALDVEGDLTSAVALALDRLRPLSGTRRVIVVTDGATARVDELPSGAIPVQLVTVGRPLDNVAIVRTDVRAARQAGSEGDTVQAFALVANFGARAREVFVTARREHQTEVLASRRIRLEPGRREAMTLSFPLGVEDIGSGLLIEVEPRDAMPLDDIAYGRIPSGSVLPVFLVARGDAPWVRRALQADPSVVLTALTPDEPLRPTDGALVVFHGLCPSALPPRNDVVVFAPPPGRCADVTVGPAIDAPEITSYVNTDARFRFLTMDGVHLVRATPLALGPRSNELLRSGEHTLVADVSTPDRAVTLVGIDPDDSDWPLRASFVLFIRNLEEVARAHRARLALGGGRAGEPLRVGVPPGVRVVDVAGPSGPRRVNVTSGTAVLGETERTGLYRVRWAGGETLVPVNLVSDAESNLRRPRVRVQPGPNSAAPTSVIRPHEELAPWLALVAAALLLANLLWLTRRERSPFGHVRAVRPTTTGGAP